MPKKQDLIIYKKLNPQYSKRKSKDIKVKYLDNTPNQILNAAIKIDRRFKDKRK